MGTWGLKKEMHTNKRGQPDIVTHTTNILNKVHPAKWLYSEKTATFKVTKLTVTILDR
jgi:hypothetical protein